jgi:hypothetical protein
MSCGSRGKRIDKAFCLLNTNSYSAKALEVMVSLKQELYQVCKEVAQTFDSWGFASGVFRKPMLKHASMTINPGFAFKGGVFPNSVISPVVNIEHRESMKWFKEIVGYEHPTSFIRFQGVRDELEHYPQALRPLGRIMPKRQASIISIHGKEQPWPSQWIGLDEAAPALADMMKDSIALIERYYDLRSQDALLNNLPMGQKIGAVGAVEGSMGVMLCVVRAWMGDFEFVERYRSDDFNTERPKRLNEVDAVIAMLPELKRRYLDRVRR